MRDWLNQNGTVVTVAAVVLLVIAAGAFYLQMNGNAGPGAVYFIEIDTGEIFTAPGSTTPPTEGPNGGQAWNAHVFSCGACEPGAWFGYVDRYSEQAQAVRADPDTDPFLPETVEFLEQNRLIRRLDASDTWVPYDSRAGMSIRQALSERCASIDELVRCQP